MRANVKPGLETQAPIIGTTAHLDRHLVACDVQDSPLSYVVTSHTRFGQYGRQGQMIVMARNRVTLEQYLAAREAECDQLRGVLEGMLTEAPCDCERCEAEREAQRPHGPDCECVVCQRVPVGAEVGG